MTKAEVEKGVQNYWVGREFVKKEESEMSEQKELKFGATKKSHENISKQSELLQLLRTQPVTKIYYEQTVRRDGNRTTPLIEKLRNAHI